MEYRVGEMVFNDWEIVREIGDQDHDGYEGLPSYRKLRRL